MCVSFILVGFKDYKANIQRKGHSEPPFNVKFMLRIKRGELILTLPLAHSTLEFVTLMVAVVVLAGV